MKLNKDCCKSIRFKSPSRWNKYKDPIDNLIFAVLLRAAADVSGYQDYNSGHNRRCTGTDAVEFLENDGELYYEYLKTRSEKIPLTYAQKKYRKTLYPKFNCHYCSCEGECVARNAPCSYKTCYENLEQERE